MYFKAVAGELLHGQKIWKIDECLNEIWLWFELKTRSLNPSANFKVRKQNFYVQLLLCMHSSPV